MINFKSLEKEIRESSIPLIFENIMAYCLEVKQYSDLEIITQLDEFSDMLASLLGGELEALLSINKFLDKPSIQKLDSEVKDYTKKIATLQKFGLLTDKFQNN